MKRRARTQSREPLFNENLEKLGSRREPGRHPLRQMRCMKKLILLTAVLLGATTVSHAGVRLGIGIGLPLPTIGVVVRRPVPVYVAPRPVYYVAPTPVYLAPPAPVYLAPPTYYAAPAPVYVTQPTIVVAAAPGCYGPYRCAPVYRYGHGYRR